MSSLLSNKLLLTHVLDIFFNLDSHGTPLILEGPPEPSLLVIQLLLLDILDLMLRSLLSKALTLDISLLALMVGL